MSLGQGNPKFPPRAELPLRSPELSHRAACIARDQRVVVHDRDQVLYGKLAEGMLEQIRYVADSFGISKSADRAGVGERPVLAFAPEDLLARRRHRARVSRWLDVRPLQTIDEPRRRGALWSHDSALREA